MRNDCDAAVRIAGAGVSCQDYVFRAPRTQMGNTGRVTAFQAQGGGLVATALVACARLGAECDLFTLLGDDQVGYEIVAELQHEGVDTSGVLQIHGSDSPVSFIHVDDDTGERTIYHRPGSGLKWDESHSLERIAQSQALIVDDNYLDMAVAAAKMARSLGIPVVADLIPDQDNEALLRHVDILIAPRHYAREISCENDLGEALDAIHRLGPTTAVITLGADGWVYSDPTGRGSGSAFEVEVVDTTGAGDAFHGAFTYGVARGWSTPVCAEFASAVAGIKCAMPGGRTGLPTLSQTIEFLKARGSLDVWGGIGNQSGGQSSATMPHH
jgi:sulfofructose kinase